MALVLSNLDYCNALLANASAANIRKLRLIHNRAACLVTLTRLHDHITPVLRSLHWLPVPYRIMCKFLVYVDKCLAGLAPSYLCELLRPKTRHPRLRQLHDHLQLSVPVTVRDVHKCAFGVAAPTYWNDLPPSLRAAPSLNFFKKNPKTYLFRVAFD